MFRAIHRRLFKGAVVTEFQRLYGLNLRVLGEEVTGPGALDDILNFQYEATGGDAVQTAVNTAELLETRFGAHLGYLRLQAEIASGRDTE